MTDLKTAVYDFLVENKAQLKPKYIFAKDMKVQYQSLEGTSAKAWANKLKFFGSSPEVVAALNSVSHMEQGKHIQTAIDEYKELQGDRGEGTDTSIYSGYLSEEQAIRINTFDLIMDVTTGAFWLWNKVSRKKSEWAVEAFFQPFNKRQVGELKSRTIYGKTVFDPYRGHQKTWIASSDRIPITFLNTYNPPAWYERDYTLQERQQLVESYPPFFIGILNALIPDLNHQQLVLDWITLAMFDRPLTYLSLRGPRGTGKSIFKNIIYHLVGSFYEAGEEVLSSFNADLRNKRIVGIDDKEEIGTKRGYNKRKSMLNSSVSINEKFVQTHESERVYFSLLILSNPSMPFYVEFDERRILSPIMGVQKMETWLRPQDFDWVRGFESETISGTHLDFIRQIGLSFLARMTKKKPNPNIQLKDGTFWQDVAMSLPSFKRFVLSTILTRHPSNNLIDYEELKALYKNSESYGAVPYWASLVGWLMSGFRFTGLPLLEPGENKMDHENKTFEANKALCWGRTT